MPFFLAANKLGPALLAGCTIVLKPAGETPLTTNLMADMFAEAGLPEGVLSVVPGGPDTGRALTDNPALDKFTFTGSSAVGKEIGKIAAVLDVTTEFLLTESAATPDEQVLDEAFFRKYKTMSEPDKKKIRKILDAWEDE